MRKLLSFGCAVLVVVLLAGCSEDTPPGPSEPDHSAVLQHVAGDVIIATYRDLDVKAGMLAVAIEAFAGSPSSAALDQARVAWRSARVPWELSEAFLFGPVSTLGIDPAIDSWPVNTVDLDAVLASPDSLTPAYVNGLEGTLKGFHTIEYLLFGTDGSKSAGAFTAREYQYLRAVAGNLKGETAKLAAAWEPGGGNYADHLVRAGAPGKVLYPSQRAALEELVTGMAGIADEVGNGKINDPFTQSDLTLEESRFSANSKADFQDNIRGVLLVYTGTLDSISTTSISRIVVPLDPALDARIRSAIREAIDKIGAIPGTFTSAISNNRSSIQEAQSAVRTLQQVLEAELKTLIQTKVQ